MDNLAPNVVALVSALANAAEEARDTLRQVQLYGLELLPDGEVRDELASAVQHALDRLDSVLDLRP